MTDLIYDREFSTNYTSSVIDHVFYSTEEQKLVVMLTTTDWTGDQILAGYEDVPADVFTALQALNTNRLNGDENSSVGRYWNIWIKPHFTGFDTADLDLISVTEAEGIERLGALVKRKSTLFDYSADKDVQRVGERQFVVFFESGDPFLNSVRVFAGSVDQALVIFNEIAKVAGWGPVKIFAVTQFFTAVGPNSYV